MVQPPHVKSADMLSDKELDQLDALLLSIPMDDDGTALRQRTMSLFVLNPHIFYKQS